MEVKVEKAIENSLERSAEELRNFFREKGIASVEAKRVENQILLRVPSESADKARELLRSDFSNLVVANSQVSAGRLELTLALPENEIRDLRDYAVDQSIETIRNRIDQFGVSEPIIQRRGLQDILIQLPGIQDPERAKDIIGKAAVLEFKLVDETHSVEEAMQKGAPPGLQLLYGVPSRGDGGLGTERIPYLLDARTLMTGEYIADARVRPSSGLEGPYVELILNPGGARIFERITAENVGRRLAIVLDNRVYSAPVIKERIGGGRASITGSFDIKEARDLAIVLRAGALPAPVEIVEERTVGPSLGRDSIRQGIASFIVGSSLVLIFMIFY
ncbi:MAG: preprotein translocase subunit SecD, partial [bacterium]